MLQVGWTHPQRKSGHRAYFWLYGAFRRHLAASLSHRQRIFAHLSLSKSALKTNANCWRRKMSSLHIEWRKPYFIHALKPSLHASSSVSYSTLWCLLQEQDLKISCGLDKNTALLGLKSPICYNTHPVLLLLPEAEGKDQTKHSQSYFFHKFTFPY